MRNQRGIAFRGWSIAGALALASGLVAVACGGDDDSAAPPATGAGGQTAGSGDKLVILHTNDLHSHLMGFGPEEDYTPLTTGDDATVGGVARLAVEIADARARAAAKNEPVLLLDAGDFMMGSLFEFLATSASPELSFMQAVHYDATTLGNHEFDWTPKGLAAILLAGAANGVNVPIVASNMVFSDTDPGDDDLEAVAQAGIVQNKLVKTVGGLKVGIFGLLGANAALVTPQAAPVTFEAIADASTRMVNELRQTDGVDLVIALSHSGIDHDGNGEDRVLAQAVPGIDVIVSGHTHDFLTKPVVVGKTIIVTAGSYGQFLGELELSVTPSGTTDPPAVSIDGYDLASIDDSIPGSADTEALVDQYVDGVDQALASSNLTYKAVVAETSADLSLPDFAEAPVGDLVTDAYLASAAALEPDDPAVIAFDADGQLRAPIQQGKTGDVWLADLFRVVPLGIGEDQLPGFPLVTYYLNAADILSGLELSATQPGEVPKDYFLQLSGLKMQVDPTGTLFGRVTGASLTTDAGDVPLDRTDTETCYKIVSTSYVAGLLGVVESVTGGLLSVTAKDSDCKTPVDPTTRYIDADPKTKGVQELKQWQALLGYVSQLPDTDGDGVPNIPPTYSVPQGRIVSQ
ncbi:MAG TPA: bifunctional UDP-sugar hydrolase/5'-nucleotidase [Polyangiaceae bacterium]|nr:bifunctional UDP-sugar hydrolase/5'-nucleotidase [Polyangiaceae bacterium]